MLPVKTRCYIISKNSSVEKRFLARVKNLGIPLSVVDRSEKEMGVKAMEQLLRHLKHPGAEPVCVSVPTRLILRGSEKRRTDG